MIAYLFSSIFLAKSLAKIVLNQIIGFIPLNYFISTDIPSVTQELALNKVYDFFEWGLFFVFSLLIFLLLYYLYLFSLKRNNQKSIKYAGYFYLSVSVVTFFNILFSDHSIRNIGVIFIVFNIIYWLFLLKISIDGKIKPNYKLIFNALLTGLVFSLILARSSTLNLFIFALFPLFYFILSQKFADYTNSIAHLLLLLCLPFHSQPSVIIFIVLTTAVLVLGKKIIIRSESLSRYLYLISGVFILLYNPLFYIGVLDSVEEGFWLGWLQRLIDGNFIYRDFHAYHPPFLIWFLHIFSGLTSFSVYTTRQYFHILYLIGMIIISSFSYKLIKNKPLLFTVLIIIFSLSGGNVKNNLEIRLASGILPLLILYSGFAKKSIAKYALFSGIFVAISVFISFEVGLASLVSTLTCLIIHKGIKLKNITIYFGGFLLLILPVFGYLYVNNALFGFISQIANYSKAFSMGYFNVPMERPFQLAFFYWHIFFEYLGSNMFYWFFVQLSFALVLIGFIYKKFIKKDANGSDNVTFSLAIFGIILSRSALGRSDYYHLLFILIISIILFFSFIDSFVKTTAAIKSLIVCIFLFVIFAAPIKYFVSGVIHKYQTYGKPSGNFLTLKTVRSGILFEGDSEFSERKNELIGFISENTTDDEKIFTFPWMPDFYFLTDRSNATSYDTPYAFFEKSNQEKMSEQIENSKPRYIIYSPNMNFGSLDTGSLKLVDEYVNKNYSETQRYGGDILMVRK